MKDKKDDLLSLNNDDKTFLLDRLESNNKEIKEIKQSIKEISKSIENVYQLLLTNRNLCTNCQQQKIESANNNSNHHHYHHNSSSSNNNNNNNNYHHNYNSITKSTTTTAALYRSKTFSQDSDILTQTLTNRLSGSFSNVHSNNNNNNSSSLNNSLNHLINNSNNNNNNNSSSSKSSLGISLSSSPRVPILHLKKDISNPNLVKQWIDDTVRIKSNEKNVDEKIVKLDIGGKYYSTSLCTLTKFPDSMLGVMFSGRYELPRDKDGRVFIDRDGKLFGYILSYLRDGPLWNPPIDIDQKRKIELEMSYYGLPSFSYGQPGSSPISTPRCVCDIKNQTLGQDSDHQGYWEEIKGMTSNIKSFRLLVTMNNTLYAITERIHPDGNSNSNSSNSSNSSSSNNGTTSSTSSSASSTSGNNSPNIINNTSSVTFQFEEYNIRSNSWIFICPVLDSMVNHYFVAGVVGDCIYALPDAGLHQPIYKYDPKELRWKSAENTLKCGKTGFSLAVLDDYIYIIGGYKGSSVTDTVERYHPRTNSWCNVANMLSKRAEGSTVVDDGYIYIIGGSYPNTTIERYNPHSNQWSFVCNLSNGQFKVSTAASMEGKIYAIGAENESYSNNIVLQFNPSTNSWKRVAPLLCNSYNPHSSVILDRYVYFIPWSGSTSSVHKFESCSY